MTAKLDGTTMFHDGYTDRFADERDASDFWFFESSFVFNKSTGTGWYTAVDQTYNPWF